MPFLRRKTEIGILLYFDQLYLFYYTDKAFLILMGGKNFCFKMQSPEFSKGFNSDMLTLPFAE